MPEVLKFITFLSKPLAIHPIQVHSFKKPGVVSSVSLLLWFLVFLSGREVKIFQTGNKTTVELPAQVSKMEQGNAPPPRTPTDSKEIDKVEMDYSFTAL